LGGVNGLLDRVNAVVGSNAYDYIETDLMSSSVVRVGLMYKIATLDPVGAYSVIDSAYDIRCHSGRNKPGLAQTSGHGCLPLPNGKPDRAVSYFFGGSVRV
jgi:hypothetical protein